MACLSRRAFHLRLFSGSFLPSHSRKFCSPPSPLDRMEDKLRQALKQNPSLASAIKEMIHELIRVKDEAMRLSNEKDKLQSAMIQDLKDMLMREDEFHLATLCQMTDLRIELLKALGLNNTRGLFQRIRDELVLTALGTSSHLHGEDLWLKIVTSRPNLMPCIRISDPSSNTTQKQVAAITTIYNVISQHEYCSQLVKAQNGVILFERGPLSPQQCGILSCLSKEVGWPVKEQANSKTS